jgi:hypothetical protein
MHAVSVTLRDKTRTPEARLSAQVRRQARRAKYQASPIDWEALTREVVSAS